MLLKKVRRCYADSKEIYNRNSMDSETIFLSLPKKKYDFKKSYSLK